MVKRFTILFIVLFFHAGCSLLLAQTADSSAILTNSASKTDSLASINEPKDTSSNISSNSIQSDSIKADSARVTLAPPALPRDTIEVYFIKYKISQTPDSMLFNILKIVNNTTRAISGNLLLTGPENWSMIANPTGEIHLEAGDSAFFPVRVNIPKNSKGEVAYVFNASLIINNITISAGFFLNIPGKPNWEMMVGQNTIYYTESTESVDFKLKLNNRGNINALVKLSFEVGALLQLATNNSKNTIYIDLPAFKDTVLIYNVNYNKDLTADDIEAFQNLEKESQIKIKASDQFSTKRQSIWFKKYQSRYFNSKNLQISPLNINLFVNNIMSNSSPQFNVNFFGTILFSKEREISYSFSPRNVFLAKGQNTSYFSNRYNLPFYIKYSDPKMKIAVGDVYGTGGSLLPGLSGRGVSGEYIIDSKNKISISLASTNPQKGNNGIGFNYITSLVPRVNISTGLAKINTENRDYSKKNYSGHVSTNFNLFSIHKITAGLMASKLDFSRNAAPASVIPFKDTSVTGFSYLLGYGFNLKKFTISISTLSNKFNYVQSAATSNQATATYKLSPKSGFDFSYTGINSLSPGFPFDLTTKHSSSRMDNARLTFSSVLKSNISYSIGSIYQFIENSDYFALLNKSSLYSIQNKSIVLNGRYSISNYQKISSNLTIGSNRVTDDRSTILSNNHTISDPKKENLNTKVGLNYQTRRWRFNVGYNYNTLYASDIGTGLVEKKLVQSFDMRPSFEKFYRNKTILLNTSANYRLTLPTNSSTFNFASKAIFIFNKGWTANSSINLFTSNKIQEGEKIVSRDLNVTLGVTKSFDIPQPRIKFYNLKVICFKDMNGNKVRDDNEALLSDILIDITMSSLNSRPINSTFAQMQLVADLDGEINYYSIPQGDYKLSFQPLVNLKELFNVNGNQQDIVVNSNTTIYAPFAVAYKVKGKILIERDPNSSLGTVDVAGIRLTAMDVEAKYSYSVLTDKYGDYILAIPMAGKYKLKINNVFGPGFSIDKNDVLLDFDGIKSMNMDFKFTELKRKINIRNVDAPEIKPKEEKDTKKGNKKDKKSGKASKTANVGANNGNIVEEQTQAADNTAPQEGTRLNKNDIIANSGNKKQETAKATDSSRQQESSIINTRRDELLQKTVDVTTVKGLMYCIQVGAFQKPLNPKRFENLPAMVSEKIGNNMVRISSGQYSNEAEAIAAKQNIVDLGFPGAYVVAYLDGKNIPLAQAAKIKK